jgi:hypothetical protein
MKTWKQIEQNKDIDLIEHPLTGFLMPKSEFMLEFDLCLKEMDGTTASDYFDFYFERCSIIKSAYRFKDDDSKQDFIDACIDLGLMPSFAETLQGENDQDKLNRVHKSSQDLVNDFKSLKGKEMVKKMHSTPAKEDRQKYVSKAQQLYHTYSKLQKKYEECTNETRKNQIKQKLERTIHLMEHSM